MKIHIVQPNETLSSIAAQHGTNVDLLLKSNPFLSQEVELAVGQKIRIPTGGVRVSTSVQPVKQEEKSTLPKWWQEEGENTSNHLQTRATEFTSNQEVDPSQEQKYGSYPALDPALYPAIDPSIFSDHPNAYLEVGRSYNPVQPLPYTYAPSIPSYIAPAHLWYDPFMTMLATNRIPIPPRRRMSFGYDEKTFLQMDDWHEDWQKQEEEEQGQ